MRNHGPDHALLLEVGDALAGQRTVDLHAVDEGGNSDEAVGLNVLVELLRSGLVENDGVLGLVLDLALGPLLLLLFTSSCGRLSFSIKVSETILSASSLLLMDWRKTNHFVLM